MGALKRAFLSILSIFTFFFYFSSCELLEQDSELLYITIAVEGQKTFYQGDRFSLGVLSVKAVYSNGSDMMINDYHVEPAVGTTLNTTGLQKVIITYKGHSAGYMIDVLKKSGGSGSGGSSSGSNSGSDSPDPANPQNPSIIIPSVEFSDYSISGSKDTVIKKNGQYTFSAIFNAEGPATAKEIMLESKSEYINIYNNFITDGKNTGKFEIAFTIYGSDKIPYEETVKAHLLLTLRYKVETQIEYVEKFYDIYLNCNSGNLPISREYWGSWIQMDTGDEYYIDCESIYQIYSSTYKSLVQNGISGYSLDGQNVLCKGANVRYFRKGGSARSFSLSVSGFEGTSSRAVSAISSLKMKRVNQKNTADSQTVEVDSLGQAHFTASVADDSQLLTLIPDVIGSGTSGGNSENDSESQKELSAVLLLPSYDGENMGTIPLVEEGKYGFKVTYSIDSDQQNLCYGNYNKTYELALNLNNVGNATCETSSYNISCNDSAFEFVSGESRGNFSSIEPGKSKSLSFEVRYGKLNQEYADVPVNISITDSRTGLTWNDSVTLRFYRGPVALKVNARNIDTSSSSSSYTGQLKGFVIFPDGRSKRFTVDAGQTSTVLVPWSKSDYILAFTGATAESEMAYSFGFKDTCELADLSGIWSAEEINAYEDNNSIGRASRITDLSQPAKAYLKLNDVDFYSINCGQIDYSFVPVSLAGYGFKESSGNYDSLFCAGEEFYLDLLLHNDSLDSVTSLNLKLSSESPYVTFAEGGDEKSIDQTIKSNYYCSLYGTPYTSAHLFNNGYYKDNYFTFTVDKDCPVGTKIPFILTITDSSKNTWQEKFSITVDQPDLDINVVKYTVSDYKSFSDKNNEDKVLNPGEKIYMDVCIQNTGKSTAEDLVAKLSLPAEWTGAVSFNDKMCSYGNLSGGYYKASISIRYDNYPNGCRELNDIQMELSNKAEFSFTISDSVEDGSQIPLLLTITDKYGKSWQETINLSVVEPRNELSFVNCACIDAITNGTNNDGDKVIESGEIVYMNVQLHNSGTTILKGLTLSFSSDSEYLKFEKTSSTYGNIDAGKYAVYSYNDGKIQSDEEILDMNPANNAACIFTVKDNIPAGQDGLEVPVKIKAQTSNGESWTSLVTIKVYKAD
ncbi:MAG: bacterial Ig-like domain-containing protein [Treponema sp.]|nr:bacterial Ig-like domain-containing protein [Treponema sp.]